MAVAMTGAHLMQRVTILHCLIERRVIPPMAPRFDADMKGPLARQMLALSEELSAQMGSPRPNEAAGRSGLLRMK